MPAKPDTLYRFIGFLREKTVATVTIDGKEYEFESLSDDAKQQINNIRVADQKLLQLQQETALIQTARAAYSSALAKSLPQS